MVKGVNKTVIEVNNTGSKLFEKIVFYVTPEYGNLSAKSLRKAASDFTFNFDANRKTAFLRKRYKQKQRIKLLLLLGAAAVAALTAIIMIIL